MPKWQVSLTRDTSQDAEVVIEAKTAEEAERIFLRDMDRPDPVAGGRLARRHQHRRSPPGSRRRRTHVPRRGSAGADA
jgi:hypothetical protein